MITFQIFIINCLQKIAAGISPSLSIFFARYLAWIFGALLFFFVLHQILIQIFLRQPVRIRKIIYSIVLTAGSSLIVQWIFKTLINTKRPFMLGVFSLYEYGRYDSFPSGHSLVFAALAMTVWSFNRYWGYFFFFLAFIIGIFRVIVGVHWPIDIIAGWVFGIVLGWFITKIIKKNI